MKIRMGFVSNSSSSSFICCVSGEIETGMDIGLDDVEMVECKNEHTFYNEYLVEPLPENCDEIDEYEENPYNIPKKHCPICTMKNFVPEELLAYVIKISGRNVEEIKTEIRNNMKTYDDFKGFIDGVKTE